MSSSSVEKIRIDMVHKKFMSNSWLSSSIIQEGKMDLK
jgi:hypothetical protein